MNFFACLVVHAVFWRSVAMLGEEIDGFCEGLPEDCASQQGQSMEVCVILVGGDKNVVLPCGAGDGELSAGDIAGRE